MTGTKHAIRRAFARAAAGYDACAGLQREVAQRLDECLDEIRLSPGLILDAGCGTGLGVPLLRARFPQADIIGLDLAQAMTEQLRRLHAPPARTPAWLTRMLPGAARRTRLMPLCADLECLPLASASIDLVWSSLSLQWAELPRALAEFKRVLKPDGLLLFATLGPDTLHELRSASLALDGRARVNPFLDMHDVGDALVQAGLANPVLAMERITLTYADLRAVLADIKGIGAHTLLPAATPARPGKGLMGRQAWARLTQHYESFRRHGRLPASYEVIYGHAWNPPAGQRADGRQVIRWHRRPHAHP